MGQVIDITAKREGFRRAGVAHSETTTTWPLETFSKKQLLQLQQEPMLIVRIRNAQDDPQQPGQQDALQQRIAELEAVVLTLNSDLTAEHLKSTGLQSQLDVLTSELDGERSKVGTLMTELDAESRKVSELTIELDGERQKVAELTAKPDAATKKGK